MMRAAVIRALQGDAAVSEIAVPSRKQGQALVQVQAGSLNPLDLLIASGQFYSGHPPLPYVPGCEGVGVVTEGDSLTPGMRVRFECNVLAPYGSLAPFTVVDEDAVIPVPETVPDDMVAALGIAGMAGWLSVQWRARLEAGERVVVLGATGVVGQIAVQAARLLGASRIVAVGRNPAALNLVRDFGADVVVALEHKSIPELGEVLKEAAGGSVDVVIDTLWGAPALASLMAMGSGGRLVNIGQSADSLMTLPSATLRGRMISLLGYSNLFVPKTQRLDAFQRILKHAIDGEIKVSREIIPLEKITEAWRAQQQSPHRKLVVMTS